MTEGEGHDCRPELKEWFHRQIEMRPGWCQGACLEFYVSIKVGNLLTELNFLSYFYEIIIGFANTSYCLHKSIIAVSCLYCSSRLIDINIISTTQTFCINVDTSTYYSTCSKKLFCSSSNIVFIFSVNEDIFRRFLASYYSPDGSALLR